MKKTSIESKIYVQCENSGCRNRFIFKSPDDIVEARTIDEFDREVAPRRDIFVCKTCQKLYAEFSEEEDEY